MTRRPTRSTLTLWRNTLISGKFPDTKIEKYSQYQQKGEVLKDSWPGHKRPYDNEMDENDKIKTVFVVSEVSTKLLSGQFFT